jgi:hypothetical protein
MSIFRPTIPLQQFMSYVPRWDVVPDSTALVGLRTTDLTTEWFEQWAGEVYQILTGKWIGIGVNGYVTSPQNTKAEAMMLVQQNDFTNEQQAMVNHYYDYARAYNYVLATMLRGQIPDIEPVIEW